MTFISYAQNYEDVMLRRALKNIDKGFYIDVGAYDPVADSVTKAFYEAGWRGINIEPVVHWFNKLQQDRPEDINLQVAVGARKRKEVDFFEVVGTGLSTMDKAIAQQHAKEHGFEVKKYKVPVVSLTSICEQNSKPDIHFLKIDVEGAEAAVLKGLNLKKLRPWIILLEATLPNSQVEDFEGWEPLLTDRGFHLVYFDGLNRFYIADEHKELDAAFTTPPNYFDHFKRASEDWLEQHAQCLKNEWDAAKSKIDGMNQSLEIERDAAKSKIDGMNQIAHGNEEKHQKLEAQLQTMNQIAHDNEEKHQKLEAQLQTMNQIAHDNEEKHQKLEAQLQTMKTEVGQLDKKLQENEVHAHWLNNQWEEAKLKIDGLNQSSHHWWSAADGLTRELQDVYSSNSWSITAPLRWFGFQTRLLRQQGFFARIKALVKKIARPFVLRGIAFVNSRPGFRIRCVALTRKLGLYEFLRSIYLRFSGRPSPIPFAPGQQVTTEPVMDEHLPPCARRIYTDLKTAMSKDQKKGS